VKTLDRMTNPPCLDLIETTKTRKSFSSLRAGLLDG